MILLGTRLSPIGLEEGLAAIIASLVGVIGLGGLLALSCHAPDAALAAFPGLLTVALAHAAGLRADRHPRRVALLAFAVVYLQQTLPGLATLG